MANKIIYNPENPNGKIVSLTAEEIALIQQEHNKIQEIKTSKENEKQDTETKKASGKQKLLDLGLTEDEVKALIGV